MKARRTAEVYITRKGLPIRFQMSQGDTGREIELIIVDMEVPSGVTARVYVQKPSGKEVFNRAGINGRSVIIAVTSQMLAEAGASLAQVQLTSGEDIISSFQFLLEVEKNIASSSAIESSNEYNVLDSKIVEAREATARAVKAAQDCEAIANKTAALETQVAEIIKVLNKALVTE